jgi:hypothetical protein
MTTSTLASQFDPFQVREANQPTSGEAFPRALLTSDTAMSPRGIEQVSPEPVSLPHRNDGHTSESESLASWTEDAATRPEATRPGSPTPVLPIVFDRPAPRERFIALEKFEGTVLELGTDFFRARLTSRSGGGTLDEEEAEIPFEEVSEEDRDLITEGAVFYLTVGYQEESSRRRTRSAVIRFRRLPQWDSQELEAASARAKARKERLGW